MVDGMIGDAPSMPKLVKPLTPLAISKLSRSTDAGDHAELIAVGHVPGLCMRIDTTGAKAWVYRVKIGARRRSAGLGGYPATTLAMAVEDARRMRDAIRHGRDPIEARQAAQAALLIEQRRALTVAQIVEMFLPIRLAKLDTDKTRKRWRATFDAYVLPIIGTMRIGDVTKADVLRVLRQPHTNERTGRTAELYASIPDAAYKLRGRLEDVLAWAISNDYRPAPNPAAWTGNIEHELPRKSAMIVDAPYPALSIDDAPRWFAQLRTRNGNGARALEFLALTCVRSGNVRNATWSQIDMNARTWTIDADDMKQSDNGNHVVPLTDAMCALLDGQREYKSDLIFPAAQGGPLSDMTLSVLMRKMHASQLAVDGRGWIDASSGRPCVPHGLRSTFSTWANDHAEYDADMIEFALAHKVGTDVAQRYRRGSMVDKRRQLMVDWGTHLISTAIP